MIRHLTLTAFASAAIIRLDFCYADTNKHLYGDSINIICILYSRAMYL